jgi:hypothetical protein
MFDFTRDGPHKIFLDPETGVITKMDPSFPPTVRSD